MNREKAKYSKLRQLLEDLRNDDPEFRDDPFGSDPLLATGDLTNAEIDRLINSKVVEDNHRYWVGRRQAELWGKNSAKFHEIEQIARIESHRLPFDYYYERWGTTGLKEDGFLDAATFRNSSRIIFLIAHPERIFDAEEDIEKAEKKFWHDAVQKVYRHLIYDEQFMEGFRDGCFHLSWELCDHTPGFHHKFDREPPPDEKTPNVTKFPDKN